MTAYKTTPITTSPLFSYDDGSSIVVHNTSGPTFGPMFTEYAIKGRMTVASMVFNELKMMSITKDEIKKALAFQLAEELISNGSIDFTQSVDRINHTVMVRARAFVVPNGDVQLLQTLKK